jgi:hypothetical protein
MHVLIISIRCLPHRTTAACARGGRLHRATTGTHTARWQSSPPATLVGPTMSSADEAAHHRCASRNPTHSSYYFLTAFTASLSSMYRVPRDDPTRGARFRYRVAYQMSTRAGGRGGTGWVQG